VTAVTAILGLGRDVGAAIARRFDESGHALMIADASKDKLEKAASGLSEKAVTHHGDLHTKLGLRNCLAATLEAHGRVDNVLFIPPIPVPSALADLEMEKFDKAIAKTTRGAVLALRVFSEQFSAQEDLPGASIDRIRQKGSITFILSLSSKLSNPGRFTEAIAQNAVVGVMRAGALELADQAIRCNAVSAIRPRAEEDEDWVRSRTPLRRAALADEIADAALYLSSPTAAIITGETLTLDGGRSILGGVLE